jgi:hypothetical protein
MHIYKEKPVFYETKSPRYIVKWINPVNAQWLLYVPPALTLKNIPHCVHSMYLCFSYDSQNKQLLFHSKQN